METPRKGVPPCPDSTDDGYESGTIFLSNHTVAMRKALSYCLETSKSIQELYSKGAKATSGNVFDSSLKDEAKQTARSLESYRRKALDGFYQRTIADAPATNAVDVVAELSSTALSPRNFRRRFQQANLPCQILRLPQAHFAAAQSKLVRNGSVDREWFRRCLGDEAPLPVRRSPRVAATAEEASSLPIQRLDKDGRAVECETQLMSVKEWIELLDASKRGPDTSLSSYYLKDWHLQSWLATHAPQHSPLYEVPPHFGIDLLNRFLAAFCGGDYQFCYWGPAGSHTDWHSDVLHSFSWSYNVCGTKQWTFVPPPLPVGSDGRDAAAAGSPQPPAFSVRQEAGECVFVPAGWRHYVVNETEALSINHNWITTANLDLVWECLQQEMTSVEAELATWNHDSDDCEARESMLRGCVGLDVTAFFLMMAVGVLDQLQVAQTILIGGDVERCWELVFDLTLLGDMIRLVAEADGIRFFDRLLATIADEALALKAYRLATATLFELIDTAINSRY